MRTDELRSVLHDHGDRVQDAGAPARVTAVHQRVTTVKRRRAAVAGGGLVAAVAAVALAVVPNLNPSPEPVPAPGGYSKAGITFPAEAGGLQLLAASIGDRGQPELTFEAAVPDPGTLLRLSPVCYGPAADDYAVSMSVNGTLMYGTSCGTDRPEDPAAPGTSSGEEIADALDALELEPGRPMEVRVWLRSRVIDENVAETHPEMVVGGAVYGQPLDQAAVPGYTKDGVTYRSEVLGERLLGAAIGHRGQPAVSFDITVPDSGLRFSPLCYGVGEEYLVRTEIDGQGVSGSSCHESKDIDPGAYGSTFERPLAILREWGLEPGDTATVTLRLETAYGSNEGPVQRDGAVIGAGIYEDTRPTRLVGGAEVPEQVEHDGRTWQLASTYEADAGGRAVRIGHDPADEPLLLVGAVSGLRAPGAYSFELDGVEQTRTEMGAGGPTWEALHVFESGWGGLAQLKVTRGHTDSTRVSLVAYEPVG